MCISAHFREDSKLGLQREEAPRIPVQKLPLAIMSPLL